MCSICGNPKCGEYSTLSEAAKPITAAVSALKAVGYGAVGVTSDDAVVTGVPTMAHEPLTQREILDSREKAKANLKAAHERQHGLAKANDNLTAPGTDDDAPKAKAQAKAEDKAAAAPAKG